MSFKTSSRQLPNTDEAPSRDKPTPEPLADAATDTDEDAAASGEGEAAAEAAPEITPTDGATSIHPEDLAGTPAEATSAERISPAETDADAPSSEAEDPDGTPAEATPAETVDGTGTGTDADPDAPSAEADVLVETGTATDAAADSSAEAVPPETRTATATGTETVTEEPAEVGADADDPSAPSEDAAESGPDAPDAAVGGGTGDGAEPPGDEPPVRGRWRGWRDRYPVAARTLAWTTTVLAAGLVLFALLMPNQADKFQPTEFLRLPVEAIFGAALLIVLPRRPRIAVAVLAGLALGVLTILNFLDIGFNEYLGRGFNVVLDWSLFGDAQAYLQDTFGNGGALGIVGLAVALVIAVLVLMAMSVVRLGNLVARNTETATRTTLVLAIVWVTCAALGVQFTGVPIASEDVARAVQNRADGVRNTLRDEAEFAKIAKKDNFANTPPSQLLTDLRGKDMIITFIESYGRSAIEDPVMAPGVDATLTSENEKLTQAGFAARSGWLTSATYGGSSWLGHSTFMSGLWISNQQRYRTVTAGDHLTLPGAFKKTGDYDTVGVMPGIQKAWPEQKFYDIDKLYDAHHLGYKGPKFSWSTMPDQYALTAFERLVHSKKHDKPLMSTIILTSSHQPWAPIPQTVPQDQVGDGSIYDAIEKAGNRPADIITSSPKSKVEYGKSIQYSVTSLIDYLVKYGNKNTVLIFLGDHQPISRVSGDHASRDVPVSIIAKDPKVLDKIADWGWTDGLQPEHNAPVWKMDSFRDRFLTAYGSTPHP
ncbi:sulfatase-like hydrolase/transferase [Streptomyces rhizosphaerihabitans]|uniref:sulfatase-like hydrolase/transferase n=1 Tax=Streptomyces rhizosphaerihabitans TaxID=1266770 RepID=UPI0021C158FE|nr:sulfatase-like hydrolase/transferase [Streptomyces rhizosphaerihabitans]MCT9007615.1 sulfatase-like hydrolase/transferase [Streptomyces rhizosphaerihabitans]